METPRERSIEGASHLTRETDRITRRLAVLKDHLDETHAQWSALIGGSGNQSARDALILLADASHHADQAAGRALLAVEQMRTYIAVL